MLSGCSSEVGDRRKGFHDLADAVVAPEALRAGLAGLGDVLDVPRARLHGRGDLTVADHPAVADDHRNASPRWVGTPHIDSPNAVATGTVRVTGRRCQTPVTVARKSPVDPPM